MPTIRDEFYNALRQHGITTIFGNPGSTEEHMLANFPSDFRYVLGLHEGSATTMAEAYAMMTRNASVLNLHTVAGTGNAMGHLATAFMARAPIVVIAGQQERDQMMHEPYLTNTEPAGLVQPYVKWSYQPMRAQDVPASLVRALSTALQPPQGPVYLSIPADDWDREYTGTLRSNVSLTRTVATRVGPDPDRFTKFLDIIAHAQRILIVYGAAVERGQGFEEATLFAEMLNATIYHEAFCERSPTARTHPQYRGMLPPGKGSAVKALEGHDLVLCVGADAFRYYPYIPGDFLPKGARLLQVVDNPEQSARSAVGDSLISDPVIFLRLAIEQLSATHKPTRSDRDWDRLPESREIGSVNGQLTALQSFTAMAHLRPEHAIAVNESASNFADWHQAWPAYQPDSWFMVSGGMLGWAMPAAVGIALAEREKPSPRPVMCVVGEGAAQYAIQSLWTAAQLKLKIVFVFMNNSTYAILRQFATMKKLDNVAGLEIPDINNATLAQGYGIPGVRVTDVEGIQREFKAALSREGPSAIEILIQRSTTYSLPPPVNNGGA